MMAKRRLGKISDSGNFLKYFQLSVPSFALSLELLTKLFSRWAALNEDQLIRELEEISRTSNANAIFRAFQHDFLASYGEQASRNLCVALSKTAHRFEMRDMSHFFDSAYHAVSGVILGLIDKRTPKEDITTLIDLIIETSPFNTLVTDLVAVCSAPKNSRTELYNIRELANAEHVIEKGFARFDKLFLQEGVDIFEINSGAENVGYVLNRWSTKWKTSEPQKEKVSPYLMEQLSKEHNRVIRFIQNVAVRSNGKVTGFEWEFLERHYDLVQLTKLVEGVDRRSISQEESRVLDLFLSRRSAQLLFPDSDE